MNSTLDLSHLIEDQDIHQVYLARYRAEAITHKVWRLLHNKDNWSSVGRNPGHLEKRGSDTPATGSTGLEHNGALAFTDIKIDPCVCLSYKGEMLRLYRVDLARAFSSMQPKVRAAVEEHLSPKRYSAVFAVVPRWSMVRRNTTASEEVAKGAMMMGGCVQSIPGSSFAKEVSKVGV
jgi:hypothetical protein